MGPVEDATRAMVEALGALSARQRVAAEAAFRVAASLDIEPDGSKASALSRELRQLVAGLAPAAVVPVPERVAQSDVVARLQDEVAKRRRTRERGA